jgi:small subunit ribosomal protein S17
MADDEQNEQAEPTEEQPVEAEASTDAEVLEVAAEAEAEGEEVIVVASEAPPEPDPEAPPEEPGPPVPEPTSPEPSPDPLPEPVAEAAEEPPVAEPAEEAQPAEEAPAAEAPEEAPVAAEGEEAPAEEQPAPDAPAAAPAATAKKKRKRIPRSERRTRPRAKREQTGERKPITRQPKPEGDRGRRQERRGIVVSAAMDKTIVVRVDTVKAHPKYKKVVRRSHRFHAHDEQNQAKAGDVVRIVETRPLSKTKNWRLAEVVEAAR